MIKLKPPDIEWHYKTKFIHGCYHEVYEWATLKQPNTALKKALMWSVKYRKLQFCKWQEQELTLKELGQQQQQQQK